VAGWSHDIDEGELLGEQDFMDLKPAILGMDRGPVGARRHLAKLIKAEQEQLGLVAAE